jgi:hypothetical protein
MEIIIEELSQLIAESIRLRAISPGLRQSTDGQPQRCLVTWGESHGKFGFRAQMDFQTGFNKDSRLVSKFASQKAR